MGLPIFHPAFLRTFAMVFSRVSLVEPSSTSPSLKFFHTSSTCPTIDCGKCYLSFLHLCSHVCRTWTCAWTCSWTWTLVELRLRPLGKRSCVPSVYIVIKVHPYTLICDCY